MCSAIANAHSRGYTGGGESTQHAYVKFVEVNTLYTTKKHLTSHKISGKTVSEMKLKVRHEESILFNNKGLEVVIMTEEPILEIMS